MNLFIKSMAGIYIHIPFCKQRCTYCDFYTQVAPQMIPDLVNALCREMEIRSDYNQHAIVDTIYFGGGTPSLLSAAQFDLIFSALFSYFSVAPDAEITFEANPDDLSPEFFAEIRKLPFNRISMGIQSFDNNDLKTINRRHTGEQAVDAVRYAREAGFKSVSVDLIYGLPHQSLESIKPTIDTVLALDPDRLALYHYAHLPHIFKPQRRIDTEAVPGSEEKLDILQYAVHTLTERGYVFIGMDHFAKPDDELAVALREGWLQRNFQGYSTYADCDLVAIGVSSIGKIGSTYSQNERDIDAYYAAIDAGRLPIMRGYQLNRDDILRRSIIQDLMCRFALDFQLYESMFGIPFAQYFKAELADLQQLAQLGLITMRGNGLKVTPKGRFLIRNIAMVFDHHLRHKETTAKYSQTV